MAELGTITVAIEAQTEQLKKGLADAERAVVVASQKIENAQVTVADRISKSWTEFRSKLMVAAAAVEILQKTLTVLSRSAKALSDDSLTLGQKWEEVGNIIQDSNIPVASSMFNVGRELQKLITGEQEYIDLLNQQSAAIEALVAANMKLNATRQQASDIAKALSYQAEMLEAQSEEEKLILKHTREQEALEERIAELFKDQKGAVGSFERARKAALNELIRLQTIEGKRFVQAQEEALAAEEERHRKEMEMIAEREARAIEAERRKAEAAEERARKEAESIRRETEDLQTQLQVLQAEAAGDQLGAQLIELEAKFRRMRETATDDQKKIIDEIEALERQALVAAAPSAAVAADPTAATASIDTAIGGFTLAMASSSQAVQMKTQTNLLTRIADTNAAMSDALSKGGAGESVILAA